MNGFTGLEIVFDDSFHGGKPHIAFRIFTYIVDKVVSLGIQFVVREIHPGVADGIIIETSVEHACPDSS